MTRHALQKGFSRTLYYIPIIHTHTDLGALNEPVMRTYLHKLGISGLKRKIGFIDKIWSKIEHFIDGLDIPFENIRLYQDGLPVCGREAEIVEDLANAGSRNHKLLLRMMQRGAMLMGAESAELLVEEYELFKEMLNPEGPSRTSENNFNAKALSESLLKKRDRYIADRINNTLQAGESGILFLGMLHNIQRQLEKNIRALYPINHISRL